MEKRYLFEGERIKLNATDFHKMQELYFALDLTRELEQLDLQLRDTKKYWVPMHKILDYRHKKAKLLVADRASRETSLYENLTDRQWNNQSSLFDPPTPKNLN